MAAGLGGGMLNPFLALRDGAGVAKSCGAAAGRGGSSSHFPGAPVRPDTPGGSCVGNRWLFILKPLLRGDLGRSRCGRSTSASWLQAGPDRPV